MGQSPSSNGRRRDEYYYQNPPPPPPLLPPPSSSSSSSSHPSSSSSPAVPSGSSYPSRPNYYQQQPSSGYSTVNRPPYCPPPYYGANRGSGWLAPSSYPWSSAAVAPPPPPTATPLPYVEHEKAKTVKNDVNLHKGTIRLVPDEQNPDQHLVAFTFDALVDGSVTIYYFAKEGKDCNFSPVYQDMHKPSSVSFQKGLAQKFIQPSGTGFDLGFFDVDDLSKPLDGDIFPLVVYLEACPPPQAMVEQPTRSSCAQITQAVIEMSNSETFQAKVIRQILWINGERYELQEIFGLVNSAEADFTGADDDDMGKECVICLSEPRDTAVLPCRHMCMCSECAKALTLQSNKCPVCRQPVEKLMEIKVNNAES
ncbi:probable E3 ubiquitin-protein ligase LUL2 [Typha angustifolia]|uniref:probable E3 ubiquitin-protein ligase LUL2 n=1 Tax=Typha angustifolia TaxID=59011 RepID=UPI003C2F0111